MNKPFFEPPPMLPGYPLPPGPNEATIINRMKDAYIEEHPDYTDDEIDVIVEHVSRYCTNYKLVPKPKVTMTHIKIQVTVDPPKEI